MLHRVLEAAERLGRGDPSIRRSLVAGVRPGERTTSFSRYLSRAKLSRFSYVTWDI